MATTVGEGPVWDDRSLSLFFVDVAGQAVHRFETKSGKTTSWDVGKPIGSLGFREQGRIIVALRDGVFTLDLETGIIGPFAPATVMDARLQLNDVKTDRRGRFVVCGGDFLHNATNQIDPLFSIDGGRSLRILESDIGMSNGPCWAPDYRTFYFSDSSRREVYACDYDLETGSLANRWVFVDMSELRGVPDGATVDRDGLVWIAVCGEGRIIACRPDGKQERVVELEFAYPTSVMFGGEPLDQLFVTSLDARFTGSPQDDGGATFVITGLGVRGVPGARFAG